jgi:tRNA(Ile)-lysidine synthase
MNDSVIAQVRHRLRNHRGGRFVIAVSGGSDSVALLRILHATALESGQALSVAHVDHGARPDSVEDARFVAGLAESLDLPFDLATWRPTRTGHFEAEARTARYALLLEIARKRGAPAVAVGHTQDDQAETILQRLLRGTGPRGLAGMRFTRPLSEEVTLIRPLLDVSRLELRAFLERIGQPYRDDPSNTDRSRTRNRIRHELLPLLADHYNPQIIAALVRLGQLSAEREDDESRWMRVAARRIILPAGVDTAGVISLDRDRFRRLSVARRAELLRHVWREAGWPEREMNATRWRRLAKLGSRTGQRVSIGMGVEATTDETTFTLSRHSAQLEQEQGVREIAFEIPGEVRWPGGRVLSVVNPESFQDETIDLDAIAPPLIVRTPRPGDRFTPLGMGGSTALNDFFRGRRVRKVARRRVPLVCDATGIVWVVGHRIADRVRRRPETSRTLGLRWVPEGCD